MRNVVSGLFISLDGVTEAPNKWQFNNFDEDMMAAMIAHIEAEDTVLLGRVTYQEWAPYWPTRSNEPYGGHINKVPKYVASKTLKETPWGNFNNAALVKGNLAEEVARLKRQPGKNIGVAGSPTLVRSLLKDDLVDELVLMVHPVVAGQGKRLFSGDFPLKRMKLTQSEITRTGVAILRYIPIRQ